MMIYVFVGTRLGVSHWIRQMFEARKRLEEAALVQVQEIEEAQRRLVAAIASTDMAEKFATLAEEFSRLGTIHKNAALISVSERPIVRKGRRLRGGLGRKIPSEPPLVRQSVKLLSWGSLQSRRNARSVKNKNASRHITRIIQSR